MSDERGNDPHSKAPAPAPASEPDGSELSPGSELGSTVALDDAGLVDAGLVDAGLVDAGLDDAGLVDAGLGGTVMLDPPETPRQQRSSSAPPPLPSPVPPAAVPAAAVPAAMFDMSSAEPPTLPSPTAAPPDETRAGASPPRAQTENRASTQASVQAAPPSSPKPKPQPVAKVEIATRARSSSSSSSGPGGATTSSATTRAQTGPGTTKPPALTPAAQPPDRAPDETRVPTKRPPPKRTDDTSRWVLAGVLSTAAALLVGYIIVRERTQTDPTPPPPANTPAVMTGRGSATPTPAPSPSGVPPAPTAAPAPTASEAVAPPTAARATRTRAADLAACVSQSMPLGAGDGASLGFLCEQADAKSAARDMTSLVATRADVPGDTRRRWAGLGWFQMGTAQVLRARCCGDVAPMVGPPNLQACGLDAALAELDQAAIDGDLSAPAKTYLEAVDCLFKANTARLFGQRRRPNAAEQGGMLELLSK